MRRGLVLTAAGALVALLLWLQHDDSARGERATHQPTASAATDGNDAAVSGATEADDAPSPGPLPIDDDPRRIPGPDVVLTGRVERNGEPVPDAEVEARRHEDPTVIAATATDDSGSFRIAIARRTRVDLLARDRDGRHARAFVLIPHEGDPDPVVIRLEDGHSFGGIILNPDGSPHAGAIVRASSATIRTARTNAEGRFAFAHMTPGSFTIDISAVGYPVLRRHARIPELTELKATLFAGGSVRGTLRDDLGRPIGGATIHLVSGDERRSPLGRATAVTESDGTFAMSSVMPGPCRAATVEHLDWGRRYSNVWFVQQHLALPVAQVVAGEELEWNITLPSGGEIAVRVVEQGSGRPIGGAVLLCVEVTGNDELSFDPVRTDPEGRASFRHVPAAQYSLWLKAPGWAIADSRPVDLGAHERAEAQLECVPAAILEGRVVVPRTGRGNEDYAELRSGNRNTVRVRVDHNGCFRFDSVEPMEDAIVEVRSAQAASDRFDLTAGERKWVEVGNVATPWIRGVAVDGAGKPVAGALVRVMPTTQLDAGQDLWRPHGVELVETDSDGRFAIYGEHLASLAEDAEAWSIVAAHPEYRIARKDALERPSGQAPQSVSLVLRGGASISGVVLFETGQPAPNIPVEAEPSGTEPANRFARRVMTNASGEFTLRGMGDGGWRLNAIHGEGISKPIVTTAGADNVRIEIELHPPIAGILLDDEGRVIDAAVIKLVREDDSDLTTRTEPNGHFRLEHVPPGSHRLRVEPTQRVTPAGPLGSNHFEPFETEPIAAGTRDVVLRAPLGNVLRGRVIDAGGNGVPRAKVAALLDGEPWLIVTDADGGFSIKGAGEGPVELLAAADGLPFKAVDGGHEDGPITIRLPAAGSLRGRVLDTQGNPAPELTVWAHADNESERTRTTWLSYSLGAAAREFLGMGSRGLATTGNDGTFVITGLEAGTYEIRVDGSDGTSAQTTARTDATTVELALTR